MMPSRPSRKISFASGAARRTSQARASWVPAPATAPLMAATTGFSSRSIAAMRAVSRCECRRNALGVQSRSKRTRSPPAQNAVPAPVRTTARVAGSSAAASSAPPSVWASSSSSALRASGRLRVSTATPSSSRSHRTRSPVMARGGGARRGSGRHDSATARSAAAGPTRRCARWSASRTRGTSARRRGSGQASLQAVPSIPRQLVRLEAQPVLLEHRADVGGERVAHLLVVERQQSLALEGRNAALVRGPEPHQHLGEHRVEVALQRRAPLVGPREVAHASLGVLAMERLLAGDAGGALAKVVVARVLERPEQHREGGVDEHQRRDDVGPVLPRLGEDAQAVLALALGPALQGPGRVDERHLLEQRIERPRVAELLLGDGRERDRALEGRASGEPFGETAAEEELVVREHDHEVDQGGEALVIVGDRPLIGYDAIEVPLGGAHAATSSRSSSGTRSAGRGPTIQRTLLSGTSRTSSQSPKRSRATSVAASVSGASTAARRASGRSYSRRAKTKNLMACAPPRSRRPCARRRAPSTSTGRRA